MPNIQCFFRGAGPPRPLKEASNQHNQDSDRVRITIDRDGNCFYSALSFALFHSQNASSVLRKIVNKYIDKNWDKFSMFISDKSRAEFCAHHLQDGTYAEAIQVQAAAELLQCKIYVVLPDRVDKYGSVSSSHNVSLFHEPPFDSGHFDVLMPKVPCKRQWSLSVRSRGQGAARTTRSTDTSSDTSISRNGAGGRGDDRGVDPRGAATGRAQEPDTTSRRASSRGGPDADGWIQVQSRRGKSTPSAMVSGGPTRKSPAATHDNDGTAGGAEAARRKKSPISPGAVGTAQTDGVANSKPIGEPSIQEPEPTTADTWLSQQETADNSDDEKPSVIMCSCHYEPEVLEDFSKNKYTDYVHVSDPNIFQEYYPIQVDGLQLRAVIDPMAHVSLIKSNLCTNVKEVKQLKSKACVIHDRSSTSSVKGIYSPEISAGNQERIKTKVWLADIPFDFIIGKDLVKQLQEKLQPQQATCNGHTMWKEECEILNISSEPESLFLFNIRVDNKEILAAVDSGATRTILHSKFCSNMLDLRPANIRLKVANKSELKVCGQYNPVIRFSEDVSINSPVLVVNDLPVQCLIGNDILKRLRAVLDWGADTLTITVNGIKTTIPRVHTVSSKAKLQLFTSEFNRLSSIDHQTTHQSAILLQTKNKVILEPNSCTLVEINTPFHNNILPAIMEPTRIRGSEWVTSIECVLEKTLEVPIFNGSNKSFIIPKGTKVGSIASNNHNLSQNLLIKTDIQSVTTAVLNNNITLESLEDTTDTDTEKHNLTSDTCFNTTDRPELPSLENSDLTDEEKKEVQLILEEYRDVFGYELKPGSHIPGVLAHLERTVDTTIFKKNWPWTEMQRRLAKVMEEKLLKEKVIEPGFARVTLPCFIIPKRGSTLENPVGRLVWDARALNKTLKSYKYAATTIADALHYCADKSILSVCDIVSFFHTIKMSEQSKQYLGLQIGDKRYVWARLPFGLSVSPQCSAAALDYALAGLDILKYVDDLAIGHKSTKGAITLFRNFLQKIRENNLMIRPDKTVLFQKEVPLLGLKIRAGEFVKPDPERFRPLLSLKSPKSAKELKSSLAFLAYFRKFLPKFALKTKQYNEMACEKIPFKWTLEDEKVIESMYNHLLDTATLSLFSSDLPTKLHTDASKTGIAAFLTQKHNNTWKPVGYFSRPLKKTQKAWSSFHLECLAIFAAVKYFETELMSLEKFTVVADCSTVKFLPTMENPRAPLDRFCLYLSQFQIDFEIISTTANKVPDSLSRLGPPPETEEINVPDSLITKLQQPTIFQVLTRQAAKQNITSGQHNLSKVTQQTSNKGPGKVQQSEDQVKTMKNKESLPPTQKLAELQRTDSELGPIIAALEKNKYKHLPSQHFVKNTFKYRIKNNILVTNTHQTRTVVPKILIPVVLHQFHDLCLHSGGTVLLMAIQRLYFWKNMESDIKMYVKSCQSCAQFKASNVNYGKLGTIKSPNIFEDLMLDFTHIFSKTNYKVCLVICDVYSNYCKLYPCKSPCGAEVISSLKDFFGTFGVCKRIHIDACGISKSQEFEEFLQQFNIKLRVAPSNAHFSAGRVESIVKKVVSGLKFLINNKTNRKQIWHKYLPILQFHINNFPQVAIKLSPNEIIFGKTLNSPFMNKTALEVEVKPSARITLLHEIREQAVRLREQSRQQYKEKYDKHRKLTTYSKNTPVFVWFERKASKDFPVKLQPQYRLGTIYKKVSDILYIIKFRRNNGKTWLRLTHLTHIKPHVKRPQKLKLQHVDGQLLD